MFKPVAPLLLTALLTTPVWAKVEAEGGFVRLLPPGTPNTAAFMTLRNDGDTPVRLVAGASSAVGHVELHTHRHENGMMRMRQIEAITVPAKGSVQLQPGGLHVMLFDLRAPLQEGESFPLTLTFDDGQQLSLSLPVRPVVPMQGGMKKSGM